MCFWLFLTMMKIQSILFLRSSRTSNTTFSSIKSKLLTSSSIEQFRNQSSLIRELSSQSLRLFILTFTSKIIPGRISWIKSEHILSANKKINSKLKCSNLEIYLNLVSNSDKWVDKATKASEESSSIRKIKKTIRISII